MKRVFLVRHGENKANLTHEFSYRKIDYPLTEKGRLQAQQTAQYFETIPIDQIYSSPLRRAQETAEYLSLAKGVPVFIDEHFREVNVGSLEGMPPDEAAWSQYREVMRHWLSGNSEARFPGGESRRELTERFREGLEILRTAKGQSILLVGHGGIFTHGVADLCGIADLRSFFSRENHNCSVSELLVDDSLSRPSFQLIRWGDVSHLSGIAGELVEGIPEFAKVKYL